MRTMEEAGFELPCELSSNAIATLRGMAAVSLNQDYPYAKIIELIEDHGTIKLWAEF